LAERSICAAIAGTLLSTPTLHQQIFSLMLLNQVNSGSHLVKKGASDTFFT
jgi:hypothetical protein